MITLKDILQKVYNNYEAFDTIDVEYRTFAPDGEDMYFGGCKAVHNADGSFTLTPCDGDIYLLDDTFTGWRYMENYIEVWFIGEWIKGESEAKSDEM